jgi:hypothetical protein
VYKVSNTGLPHYRQPGRFFRSLEKFSARPERFSGGRKSLSRDRKSFSGGRENFSASREGFPYLEKFAAWAGKVLQRLEEFGARPEKFY